MTIKKYANKQRRHEIVSSYRLKTLLPSELSLLDDELKLETEELRILKKNYYWCDAYFTTEVCPSKITEYLLKIGK